VAYLVAIIPTECQLCGKRATVTLYTNQNVKAGDYCQHCGDIMRLDLMADEYYAQ
jgi:hypothetical protein